MRARPETARRGLITRAGPLSSGIRSMATTRKPFAEFAAELAAGLRAGRDDQPIAETARLKIIEVAPEDWRLSMVLTARSRWSATRASAAARNRSRRSSIGWLNVRGIFARCRSSEGVAPA